LRLAGPSPAYAGPASNGGRTRCGCRRRWFHGNGPRRVHWRRPESAARTSDVSGHQMRSTMTPTGKVGGDASSQASEPTLQYLVPVDAHCHHEPVCGETRFDGWRRRCEDVMLLQQTGISTRRLVDGDQPEVITGCTWTRHCRVEPTNWSRMDHLVTEPPARHPGVGGWARRLRDRGLGRRGPHSVGRQSCPVVFKSTATSWQDLAGGGYAPAPSRLKLDNSTSND
jgi:hypothetical protein